MQLYVTSGSPFARVARIVALELRAPVELVEITEFPPRQVEAVNPAMQVPTLIDQTNSVFGTKLIAEYLMTEYSVDATGGNSGELVPFAAAPTRGPEHWHDAQVLVGLEALLNALVSRSYLIWMGVEHRPDALIPLDLAERELMRAQRLLDWLEGEATRTGFIPEIFSLQDIWLISTMAWTEARIAIEWRGHSRLEAIVKRHAKRASVLATPPGAWQPEV